MEFFIDKSGNTPREGVVKENDYSLNPQGNYK